MSFADEMWDSFDVCSDRAVHGEVYSKELEAFIRKRADIEKDYAKKLTLLCKSKEPEIGTLETAWKSVLLETENIGKNHMACAEQLYKSMDETLKAWQVDSAKQRKLVVKTGNKLRSDLESAYSSMNKSMSKYESHRKKKDGLEEELTNCQDDKKAGALTKKIHSEEKSANKADDAYNKNVLKARELENRFYDVDMPRLLSEIEKLEEERIRVCKTALERLVEHTGMLGPGNKTSLDYMEQNVSLISAESDNADFVKEHRTNAPPIQRCEYVPYDPISQSCKRNSVSVEPSRPTSQHKSAPASKPSSSPVRPAASAVPAAAPPEASAASMLANRGAPPAVPAVRSARKVVRAIYAYHTEDEGELDFDVGEMITIVAENDDGWWKGELNGVTGLFPSNHIQEKDGTIPDGPADVVPGEAEYEEEGEFDLCKVLYAYTAEEDDEISIQPGDVLTIEEEDDEGWYYGHRQSDNGYGKFPGNYVEVL